MEPTPIPTGCPADNTNAFFPTPIATHCRNPSITSICQVPSWKTFQCLTFEQVLIFSPFLAAITEYQGYQFETARPDRPDEGLPFALISNNKFQSGVSFASTWPNFLLASFGVLPVDFRGILISRVASSFDVVSLTIASNTPDSTMNFTSTHVNGSVIFNYQVGGIGKTPSLVILNWTNISNFYIYANSVDLGVDSIVISR
jgi:hypothetical protein